MLKNMVTIIAQQKAAILAVIVVPIFSPSTIAAPIWNGIQPILIIISVRAIVALDDCKTSVSTVPNNINISTYQKPISVQPWINDNTSGVSFKSGTDSFISDKPRKSNEKPMMHSLKFLLRSFFDMRITKPNAISGTARIEMSALKPKSEISQAVTVVPMLAPIITPIA